MRLCEYPNLPVSALRRYKKTPTVTSASLTLPTTLVSLLLTLKSLRRRFAKPAAGHPIPHLQESP